MKRLYDYDSDRYHTAMAASAWVLTLGALFLIFVTVLAGGIEFTVSGWIVAAMIGGVVLLQLVSKRTLLAMFHYLRSRPWKTKPKRRRKFHWQRIPLPSGEGEENTWRPFEADPKSNDWPGGK